MNIDQIALAACVGLTLCCIIGTMLTLAVQLRIWVKLEAFEKSTHQIQYVPIEDEDALTGEKLEDNIRKAMGQEQIEREYV
jgi:hypothetical protein